MTLQHDEREIASIHIGPEQIEGYVVGHNGVTRISVYMELGQMAMVPWFNVWSGDEVICRVNAAFVSTVEYV